MGMPGGGGKNTFDSSIDRKFDTSIHRKFDFSICGKFVLSIYNETFDISIYRNFQYLDASKVPVFRYIETAIFHISGKFRYGIQPYLQYSIEGQPIERMKQMSYFLGKNVHLTLLVDISI